MRRPRTRRARGWLAVETLSVSIFVAQSDVFTVHTVLNFMTCHKWRDQLPSQEAKKLRGRLAIAETITITIVFSQLNILLCFQLFDYHCKR